MGRRPRSRGVRVWRRHPCSVRRSVVLTKWACD
ncbi:hypothetical protein Rrhod_0754 [Rhodococcus rhodnii LMG 5362]|uniref:Uncharacterized protein n=1 Tax=Rhodococcus rhodnii LMG 5362 TaxID=1273125 RepID=R7WRD4_9NOCA|nr:hypothetical protein Rrhod_0754 [Rhodococcus rhodnii LMG 5362]